MQKLEEEVHRCTQHVILGIQVDTDQQSIRLHGAKRAGARVLFNESAEWIDFYMISLPLLQQIRCSMDHFKTSIIIWSICVRRLAILWYIRMKSDNGYHAPANTCWADFGPQCVC